MSYIDCINKSKISPQKKKEAKDIYNDKYKEQINLGVSEKEADFIAGERTAEIIEVKKLGEKKRLLKTVQAQQSILKNLESYKNRKGENDYGAAALSMFESDGLNKFSTVVGRADVIKGQAHAQIADFLQEYSAKYSGVVRPKAGLNEIVRGLFGEVEVSDTAKELSDSISKSLETLRLRANNAGANIGKKENYGMPQVHDSVKIMKASRDEWVDFVSKKLDWEKMKSPETGELVPLSKRKYVLENVYDTIKTSGYNKLKQGEMARLGALDKRVANHRFLEFKDAQSWIEYQEAFGVGTPFDVIVGHIDRMSRDVAMMEIFGPNPNQGLEFLKSSVRKKMSDIDLQETGPMKESNLRNVEDHLSKLDEMYAVHMNTSAGNPESRSASLLAGIRNLLTSSFLGSASLLAIPGDFFTKTLTRSFNKMPASQDILRYAKLMNPASKADRMRAARSGMVAETWTSMAYGQQRFMGDIIGPEWTKRIADVVLRASLLTPHTQASRWAFGMEFMGALADNSKVKFDDLPFKSTLERYGLTAKEWDVFRKTPLQKDNGVTFLRPDDMRVREDVDAEYAQEIADRFMEVINTEMEFAVPSSSLRSRTFLVSDSKAGTLVGELARSGAMFKNFPVTILFTHGRRALHQKNLASKLSYAAAFGLGMTAMGALGLQMRQISQGKNPLNMNPLTKEGLSFWGQASLTGGGMGIWGDFLFSNTNRFGQGIETTLAGPVAGFASDTVDLTVGNLMEVASGEETKLAKEVVRYVNNYSPAKSLWYARLVLQREIFDQALLAVDPKAASKFRAMERKQRKEKNQKSYWPRGKSLIQGDNIKKPDFSSAFQE